MENLQENARKNEALFANLSGLKSGGGDIIPLKNVRILLIGGHEVFISKMKKIYPNWVYLSSEERNCKGKVSREYDLIVAKTDHMSHNIMEKALAHIDKNIPIIYSHATNINRTIAEIETGYKQLVTKCA